jgi:hypothetical protein
MNEVKILERETVNITLKPEHELFIVNLVADVEYDENGFNEFLRYF